MFNIKVFFYYLISMRSLIFSLAKNDLKEKYSGSLLGLSWSIMQPLFTICVMWFVFSFGFRTVPIDNVPFILWLSAGMIPWFFLSEAFIATSNCIVERAYLVKKVVFRVSLLPIIKVISLIIVHFFLIILLLLMCAIYGYYPEWIFFQLFYYLFASIAMIIALSYITSTLVVFSKDFGQIIGIFVQFLFWATPIFWNLSLIPINYQWIFKLNPCWYIVNGYRDTLIYHKVFWHDIPSTVIFWGNVIIIGFIGMYLFKKLKPHFADIL